MLFGLLGMLFTDCDGPLGPDTALDSGDDEQTVWITSIRYQCDASSWLYTIETVGDTGGLLMTIYDTSDGEDHAEEHEIYAVDESGVYEFELSIVYSDSDVINGSSTLFACPTAGDPEMIWHLELLDEEGREDDCAVFGDDPATLINDCPIWS